MNHFGNMVVRFLSINTEYWRIIQNSWIMDAELTQLLALMKTNYYFK